MIICIIDFLLDPLKPHFYYISTGLMGSFSHGEISLMTYAVNAAEISHTYQTNSRHIIVFLVLLLSL